NIPAAGINAIDIDLGAGDDTFEIGRRLTPQEMIANGAAGNRAMPQQQFPPTRVDGGDGDDTIRNFSASNVEITGGAGQNTVANYGDNARIIGGEGARDTVANAGNGATIDYSRAARVTIDQIADRGTITGSPNADIIRIRGNDNTVRP